MSDTIKFDLLSNATDSLDHAVDLLAYEQEVGVSIKYKRAIQSISHSIELLLKERLRQVHPALIWENVDRYPSLDARTVTSDSAINRLNRIGGIHFSQEELKLLKSLKKIRNAIEHYKWSISEKEAEYIIGKTLAFAVYFCEFQLNYDLFGYSGRRDGSFQDIIASNKHFTEFYQRSKDKAYCSTFSNVICEFCKAIGKDDEQICPKCGHENVTSSNSDFWDDDNPF